MYQLTETSLIKRAADGALIPPDEANVDWREYLSWLAEGNTPEPAAVLTITVPSTVTMRQAQLALLAADKLDQVTALIAESPRAVQIAWSTAGTVERSNPLISSLSESLGLTNQDLDNLFIQASQL